MRFVILMDSPIPILDMQKKTIRQLFSTDQEVAFIAAAYQAACKKQSRDHQPSSAAKGLFEYMHGECKKKIGGFTPQPQPNATDASIYQKAFLNVYHAYGASTCLENIIDGFNTNIKEIAHTINEKKLKSLLLLSKWPPPLIVKISK